MSIESIGIYVSLLVSALIAIWAVLKSFIKKTDTSNTPLKPISASSYFTALGFLDRKRIFFSVFATTFSAFTVVGLPAMFYVHGIGALWFMWVGILLTPFTMLLIGKKIVKHSIEYRDKFSSPIGLLTQGYNSQSLTIALSLITIVVLFPYLTLQIAGIGKFVLSTSNGEISYFYGTLFCCSLVAFYVITGGAKADAETDLIQGILLIVGTIVLGISIFLLTNNSLSGNYDKLNDLGLLSIPGPKGYFTIPLLFSYGIIFTLISVSTPQVSQKLMGIEKIKDLNPLIYWYWIIGSIVVLLAGLIGFYAAANLSVSSPDFVAGDVLRDIGDKTSGSFHFIYMFVAILFMSAVLSAAISTIDSLLLAVSGIVSDNFYTQTKPKLKFLTLSVLFLGLLFSSKPPTFIVSLAQIQLSGLTSLLPCLLGPLFGISSKSSGWLSLTFGITPLIIINIFSIPTYDFDIGVIGLFFGLLGLFIGQLLSKRK